MDGMDEIIGEFLVESNESLDRLDRELIELEANPTSRELLASIFRTVHTIKGTAGFLGFGSLESLTHAGENLLSLLRDGKLVVDEQMTSALLSMVDSIRGMLASIERTATDVDGDTSAIDALTRRLGELAKPSPPSETSTVSTQAPAAEVDAAPDKPKRAASKGTASKRAASKPSASKPTASKPRAPKRAATKTAAKATAASEPVPAPVAAAPIETAPLDSATSGTPSDGPNVESSIRVDVRLLDQLMNLVGELVLARNQIIQFTGKEEDTAIHAASQQLNLITTELQESVMKTRMQPIGNIWGKFPRVVRDLATVCAKQVRIEMEGEETELDKTIIEAIKDPLTHVVRNAVDHGIESPDVRVAAGKPAEGTLHLRAYHEGGQVIIEIADDGAGLDHDRIRAKAIERGLVTSEQAGRMSEREVANLIFVPGFSTAQAVTNVSGRGVGMDVVKTNIEKIGGTLDVQSTRGEGTTLTVKIPLTLAIIPALIVSCDGDRYAIPQVNLVELLRLEDGAGSSGIEYVSGVPVYRSRGRLLPIVHLRELLGLAPVGEGESTASQVAVLQADNQQFGLVVDRIDDSAEIVVKPLGPHLKGISAFTGTTIMGDGNVALILDTMGIGQQGGVLSGSTGRRLIEEETATSERRHEQQTVVVCGVGERRVAIPIALVSRLEEIERTAVEHAGGRDVVQYRGGLLSLISLTRFFDPTSPDPLLHGEEGSMLQVLVHETDEDVFGFVVDAIIDIAELDTSEGKKVDADGVLLSGVIGRRVTDLVDIAAILRQVDAFALSHY